MYIENSLLKTKAYDIKRQYLETYRYTPLGNSTVEINGQSPNISTPDVSPVHLLYNRAVHAFRIFKIEADLSALPVISQFSPNGEASGNIIYSALGCEASDFPSTVSGQIALIDRGICEFGLKVALASGAGAVGVIIAENDDTNPDLPVSSVTLGEPNRPEGDFVPTVSSIMHNRPEIHTLRICSLTTNHRPERRSQFL